MIQSLQLIFSGLRWKYSVEKYQQITKTFVEEIPFVKHKTIEWFGCSPDGIIRNNDGTYNLLEIKNPNSATHWAYIKAGEPPTKYKIQHYLKCSTISS